MGVGVRKVPKKCIVLFKKPLGHFCHIFNKFVAQNHSSEINAFEGLVFHFFGNRWWFYKAYFVIKKNILRIFLVSF